MNIARNLLVIATVAAIPTSASANGLLYKLPADGSSALYEMSMNAKTRNVSITGTMSVSSVGKAKAGGKDCRWIEFTMVMSMNGQQRTVNAKVLIPEEDLGKGKNALKNPQKGWLQMQGQASKEITDFGGRDAGPLPALLGGPLANAKKLEAKEIDTGLGKLKCAGETGKHSYKQAKNQVEVSYQTRLNSKSPFGVAHSKMILTESRDGQVRREMELTFKIKSVGKNAKSKLPDLK